MASKRFLMLSQPARAISAAVLGATLALAFAGCSNQDTGKPTGNADTNVESVKIDGEWFHLELAADPPSRYTGLSGREFVEPDGGMLFVFPSPGDQRFVMRDCLVPIDIIFLDASGSITAMHKMPVEPPRDPETEPITDPRTGTSQAYENRLTRYPSRYPAQFVIELAGNTLDRLDLSDGDRIEFADIEALKARAR